MTVTLATFQVGRLTLGSPPTPITEPVSDPVASVGGAVVPGARTAPQFQVALATYLTGATTLAQAQALRRKLRALLNNTPLKLQAFLYVVYSDDTEQNGWYVPDATTLSGFDKASWKAIGLWQTGQGNWLLAGRRRTHREAREVWMKDLRTGLYPRDALGLILSTDFSALPTVQLSVLPSGASVPAVSVSGQVVAPVALPTGRDGGACQLVSAQSDMTVISYERPETALNLSDVIVYDRRGQITAPSAGPDTNWEEVYGPDYPWNWQTAGQPSDTPVVDNGLVRVRYDGTNTPGFRVDVWNGASYVEQGKMVIQRVGDTTGYLDTWNSASLAEWTPERAVLRVVLSRAADPYSRERVYITVQRGELGAQFECYPALKSGGGQADTLFLWTPNGAPDSNDFVFFEPSTAQPPASATDQIWSTASSNWTSAAGTFSSSTSNYVGILRSIGGATTVGPYQATLTVVQQGLAFAGLTDSHAYGGAAQSAVSIASSGGKGYCQVQVAFVATQSGQVQGAVSSWTAAISAQYRVFALVSGSFSDKGEYTGSAVTTTSATMVVAFLTQDRTRAGAQWGGSRDAGQSALSDSRMLGRLVARV